MLKVTVIIWGLFAAWVAWCIVATGEFEAVIILASWPFAICCWTWWRFKRQEREYYAAIERSAQSQTKQQDQRPQAANRNHPPWEEWPDD